MKTITKILFCSLLIYSCSKEETNLTSDSISNSQIENQNLQVETFVFENKQFEIKIDTSENNLDEAFKSLPEELAQIFELPELVTYYDNSGTTHLFRSFEEYSVFDKTLPSNKADISGDKIVGYAKLYADSYYGGYSTLSYDTGGFWTIYNEGYPTGGTWNDKASSLIVQNAKIAFYRDASSNTYSGILNPGRTLIVHDTDTSSTAIGYSRLKSVTMQFLTSWNDQISEAQFLIY